MDPTRKTKRYSPTILPQSDLEAGDWQKSNRDWWDGTPMRYDWQEKIDAEPGTPEFFDEIDKRFFTSSNEFLPSLRLPFDRLIPFESLKTQDVLEIGIGYGSHAALIAPHCKSFVGIDLTEHAVQMTVRRFELSHLPGQILRMDAEKISFPDSSFDFIWSWGVIHHSSNTQEILNQMHRVLRPGGGAIIMVYHRSWWKYYVECMIVRGIFKGEWLRYRSLNKILQCSTDGALARFYKPAEFDRDCAGKFSTNYSVYGLKTEILPIPHSRLKSALIRRLPSRLVSFFTHTLRFGSFLVIHLRKT